MEHQFKVQRTGPKKGKERIVTGHSLRAAASAASKRIPHINHTVTWERLIALEPGRSIVVDVPLTSTSYEITRVKGEE